MICLYWDQTDKDVWYLKEHGSNIHRGKIVRKQIKFFTVYTVFKMEQVTYSTLEAAKKAVEEPLLKKPNFRMFQNKWKCML